MAQFTSQTGFKFPMPEFEFFRTDDPDNIYRRTPQGIEAFSTRIQPDPTKPATQALSAQELAALPKFSSGIVTDLARSLGQSTLRVTGPLTPELKAQLFQKQVAPSISQPLDAQTAALVKTGGAGIGGFAAGGQAGLEAGLALQTTPEAVANRLRGIFSAPITGDALVPQPVPQLRGLTPSPVSDISGLESATIAGTLTGPEKEESEMSKKLRELNERIIGRAAFTTEQGKLAGIPETEQALDDLNVRLRDLQKRAAAIPIQLQEGAAGRGITTQLLGRQQEKLLRDNAIEALTISSLIDATQNKLTSAQRKVDRAVAEKYDPIIEEINIKTANAKLIRDNPEYSAADRKRAARVIEAQTAEKAQVDAKKAEQKEIWDTMNDAVKGGLRDTVIMEQIRTAKTKEEALQIAMPYLAKKEKEPSLGADFERYKFFAKQRGEPVTQEGFMSFQAAEAASRRAPGDIDGIVDIRQRRKDLADLLAEVTTYASREEAEAELNRLQNSIKTRVGESGFDQIKNEIDRLFPKVAAEAIITPEKTGILSTIAKGAQFIKKFDVVGNFFSRLFGK